MNGKSIFSDDDQIRLIILAIADVTDLEYNRRGFEQLVEKRLVDFIKAKEEVEASLREIKKLKDLLEAERAYL